MSNLGEFIWIDMHEQSLTDKIFGDTIAICRLQKCNTNRMSNVTCHRDFVPNAIGFQESQSLITSVPQWNTHVMKAYERDSLYVFKDSYLRYHFTSILSYI